jgi:hypothetical protein
MSLQPFATSLGAVIGNVIVIACDFGPSPKHSIRASSLFHIDEFTLVFLCGIAMAILKFLFIGVFFKPITTLIQSPKSTSSSPPIWEGNIELDEPGPSFPRHMSSKAFVRYYMIFFCSLVFLMNVSVGFVDGAGGHILFRSALYVEGLCVTS